MKKPSREIPRDPDPEKGKGEWSPHVYLEKWGFRQRSIRTKMPRQSMPGMTGESGPVYTEGNKRQGPHIQQWHDRLKSQLTLAFVSEKIFIF